MSINYTLIIYKFDPLYSDICSMYDPYNPYNPYDYSISYSCIDIDEEYLCILKLSHHIERTPYLDTRRAYKTYLLRRQH